MEDPLGAVDPPDVFGGFAAYPPPAVGMIGVSFQGLQPAVFNNGHQAAGISTVPSAGRNNASRFVCCHFVDIPIFMVFFRKFYRNLRAIRKKHPFASPILRNNDEYRDSSEINA
jgi:hypothetical protein